MIWIRLLETDTIFSHESYCYIHPTALATTIQQANCLLHLLTSIWYNFAISKCEDVLSHKQYGTVGVIKTEELQSLTARDKQEVKNPLIFGSNFSYCSSWNGAKRADVSTCDHSQCNLEKMWSALWWHFSVRQKSLLRCSSSLNFTFLWSERELGWFRLSQRSERLRLCIEQGKLCSRSWELGDAYLSIISGIHLVLSQVRQTYETVSKANRTSMTMDLQRVRCSFLLIISNWSSSVSWRNQVLSSLLLQRVRITRENQVVKPPVVLVEFIPSSDVS